MADVEWLLRKLEPLDPQKVRRWREMRQTADAELKNLIDRQIIKEAKRQLGDYENQVLLTLPPEKLISGPLNLGTVFYNGQRWPAGLQESELVKHLFIAGSSGAGKTNLVLHLLLQLEQRGIPWLFLDHKRTARHLIQLFRKPVSVFTPGRPLSPLGFNPFIPPPGLEPRVYMGHVVDVLAGAYTLGEGARRMLQKSLLACAAATNQSPSVADVLRELEQLPDKGRASGWKLSAQRALESLAFVDAIADRPSQEEMTQTLLHGNTIIELDGLPGAARAFLVPLILLWLFHAKLGLPGREKLDLVIVLEEAHHFLYRQERRARESLVNSLLRQFRELSIGCVVVDQHPHLIASAALGNCFASVCLNLKDPADVSRAAAMSLVEEADRSCFGRLPVGCGVVKLQDRWTWPFLIRIPHVPVAKGGMTDPKLRDYLANGALRESRRPGSARIQRSHEVISEIPGVPVEDDPFEEGMLALLTDVVAHPDDGVRVRYRRLGFGGSKGHRLQSVLVRRGWLERQLVPVGNTRKLILHCTDRARRITGASEQTDTPGDHVRRESIIHRYWKEYYARRLRQLGYEVEIETGRLRNHSGEAAAYEAEASGGRGYMDVLGRRKGSSVAVEIETGKSDAVENVRQCLKAKINQVLVVVTDPSALVKIETALAKSGLLVPRRVTVVRAGAMPENLPASDAWTDG